jgi:hypothetical protein
MRWAFVDGDGTILSQSGGISLANHTIGVYTLDLGSNQGGKMIQVTPARRNGDADTITATAAVCGGPPAGMTCAPGATNTRSHILVSTYDAPDGPPNDQAFYVMVF